MQPDSQVLKSCEQITREELPNLLRLYLNPHVTQVCYCLNHYVRTTWAAPGDQQMFLANSLDEALSGAIKLARYDRCVAGLPVNGLVADPSGRLGPYIAAPANGSQVEYIPGLTVAGKDIDVLHLKARGPFGFLVLVACGEGSLDLDLPALRRLRVFGPKGDCSVDSNGQAAFLPGALRQQHPLVITCVDRGTLAALRRRVNSPWRELVPDIVVFDETFVDHEVPFAALAARKNLYDHWNRPGKMTFHSTTFQPNTLASLHFMRCLEKADPEFYAVHADKLKRVLADRSFRGQLFRDLYSPSLYRMTCTTGFDLPGLRARGNYVHVGDRTIFDAVSGVACSVRGHNPPSYVDELSRWDGKSPEVGAAATLQALTGLEHILPAVSGAAAVENALRIALVAQYPRRHVLALRSGFGGKTLLALTATAHPAYKENIGPLYDAVSYVDPFALDAINQIEAVLEKYPVAVVQVELVQAVGGVRQVPQAVIRFLETRRLQAGYLMLVDEVQTGMYRTGPFTLSSALGLNPDLLLLGKGTSDMMFPFALVVYSDAVQQKLKAAGSDLPGTLRKRYGYALGYRTICNVLAQAAVLELSRRVAEASALFRQLLIDGLEGCKIVRDVRVYGLLIGIELDTRQWPQRLFRKRLYSLYLYAMLRHARYPVLCGFCQCEPNVLKITPALTVGPDEIRQVCGTIVDVLRQPFHRVLATAFRGLLRSFAVWRKHEHTGDPANEFAAR